MDSEKDQAADSRDSEAHHAPEPVIETVARAEPEPKPKEKPKKSAAKQHAATNDVANKHSAGRIAKKKKKRAAHRIKLKRSNTKG